MIFQIKNFGKINEATIKLDGITVICGDNNTGKSTVGKAVFSFFNSLCDYKKKIATEKLGKVREVIFRYSDLFHDPILFENSNDFFLHHEGNFTTEEVKKYMNSNLAVKLPEDKLVTLVQYLNSSETDIINEYVLRYFNSVMNGQVENIYSSSGCSVAGAFRNGSKSTIHMENGTCSCSIGEPIEKMATAIPPALDGGLRLHKA